MPFDPSLPFETLQAPATGGFDPSQPFDVLEPAGPKQSTLDVKTSEYPQIDNPQEQSQPGGNGLLSSVSSPFVRTAEHAAKSVNTGMQSFTSGLADIATYISEKTGLPKGGLFDSAMDQYKQNADYWDSKIPKNERYLPEEVVGEFLGASAPAMADFLLGVPYAAIKGGVEGGAGKAAFAGAKRLLMGQILEYGNQLRIPERVGAMATIGGAQAAAEGGNAKDIAKGAGTMGLLGLAAGGGGISGNQAFRNALDTIKTSDTYRNYTIKERGLVVQSLDDMMRNNPDMSEGDIIRQYPQFFNEALQKRAVPEVPKVQPEEILNAGTIDEAIGKFKQATEGAKPALSPELPMPELSTNLQAPGEAISSQVPADPQASIPKEQPPPVPQQDASLQAAVQNFTQGNIGLSSTPESLQPSAGQQGVDLQNNDIQKVNGGEIPKQEASITPVEPLTKDEIDTLAFLQRDTKGIIPNDKNKPIYDSLVSKGIAQYNPDTEVYTLKDQSQQENPNGTERRQEGKGRQWLLETNSDPSNVAAQNSNEIINNPDSVAHTQEVNTAPSQSQAEAGNYKKAHINLDGMNISIENPAGSTRTGTDANGRAWSTKMNADYGYIKGSVGYDKDHVDVVIAPGYKGGAQDVYVVNQHSKNGKFDEHKAVIGASSEAEAMQIYNSNYEKGWDGGKSIAKMSIDEFKTWAKSNAPKNGALPVVKISQKYVDKNINQQKQSTERTSPNKAAAGNVMGGEVTNTNKEKLSVEKSIKRGDVSVGDTVYFTDVRDESKRIPANFRGFDGNNAVVVKDGQQMSLPINRIFKNDAEPTDNTDALTQTPTLKKEDFKIEKFQATQVGYIPGKPNVKRKVSGWKITEPDGNERNFSTKKEAEKWVAEYVSGNDGVLKQNETKSQEIGPLPQQEMPKGNGDATEKKNQPKNETTRPINKDSEIKPGGTNNENITGNQEGNGRKEKTSKQEGKRGPAVEAAGLSAVRRVGKSDIESDKFRNFFGKSEVTTSDGKPLVVEHGSPSFGITDKDWTFDNDKLGKSGSPMASVGHYFTPDHTEAARYTGGTGNIKRFYLRMEKPLVLNSYDWPVFKDSAEAIAWRKRKELQGYDGIIVPDQDHYIIFDGGQAKSAEYNTGEWSRDNKDTRDFTQQDTNKIDTKENKLTNNDIPKDIKEQSPKKKELSDSHLEKIEEIKSKFPHIDDEKLDMWVEDILSGEISGMAKSDNTYVPRMVLSEMVKDGIVDQSTLFKYDRLVDEQQRENNYKKLVVKTTGKKLEDLKPSDIELLRKNNGGNYPTVRDRLLDMKETPAEVKQAFKDEIKSIGEAKNGKVIKEYKDYVLSKTVVGDIYDPTGTTEPTDEAHLVRIDNVSGTKTQKIAKVQKIVEEAVNRLSETEGKIKAVRFSLPDGTEYTILNNQKALRSFKKIVQKVYTPIKSTAKKETQISTKQTASSKVDWGNTTASFNDGWVSDNQMIIKDYSPPKRPRLENGPSQEAFETYLHTLRIQSDTSAPAEVRYYATGRGEQDKGVSKEPVPSINAETTFEKGNEPSAILMDTATNKRYEVSQGKLNIVKNTYPDVEYRIDNDGIVFGMVDGEMVAAIMPRGKEKELHNEDMAKSSGLYSMGDFADTPVIMELPELVELATDILGGNKPQLVAKFRKMGVRGQFIPQGTGNIKILRALGSDFHQALKTIAHEIGHLVDYKDENTMSRGNILGRIASLKKYLKHYLSETPGGTGPLTKEDRNRLLREAREVTKLNATELIDEVITRELPVTPEQVLAVLKGIETDPEPSADVIHFIFTASTAVKKSLALQAMRGLSPKEMDHLKTYIEEKTGNKIGQDTPTQRDVYAKFKELVKEEIAKRKLISKEIITQELKNFTQAWKPFDQWADKNYTKYRFSSEELYADALSGILTNPMMVKRIAPTFYKGFFDYIDQKPETSKVWEEIAKRIGRGPEEVSRSRIASDYEMFYRDEAKRTELANEEPPRNFMDTLRVWLDDKNHFINKALLDIEKGGGKHAEKARLARNQLKENNYIPSEVDAYLYEVNQKIQKVMDDNGLTVHDLDVMALRKHIAENRKDIFSTQGYTPETATADLKVLEKDWGKEKYNLVSSLLDELRNVRDKRIYPLMEKSGMYSPDLVKLMNETTDYTKVSVSHYLDGKFGNGTGGRIFKQLGTLSDVGSPVTATILQDISIIRAARINLSKRSVIPLLIEDGAAEPAVMKYDARFKTRVPAEPKDKDLSLFTVMINGQPENYYVQKYISDAYDYTPFQANQVAKVWNFIASGVRQLLISKNLKWIVKNPIRDFRDTIKKNPEIRLRDSAKLALAYKRSIGEAFAESWKKQRSETIDYLMINRALTEDRIYDGRDYTVDTEIHRLQRRYKLATAADQKDEGNFKLWKKINSRIDDAGRAMEIVSKIAGYKYLKENTNLSDTEILHRLRAGFVGTPDIKTRGALQQFSNNVFMFSNVGKEGLKTQWRAAKQNPGVFIWKTIATNIIPKILLFMATKGLFDYAMGYLNKEDGDSITGGGYIKRLVSGIPEYNISHYTCIPLFLTKDGKSVWLQIPEDYEGQTIGAMSWKVMNGNFSGRGSALSELNNLQPYNIHPLIGSFLDIKDIYINGINPVDSYRGTKKLSDRTMEVGGIKKAEAVAKNTWNDMGGSSFYRFQNDDIKRKKTLAEYGLNTFPFNAIGAFIQISDRGISEKIFNKFHDIDLQKSKQSVAIDEALSKMSPAEKLVVMQVAPKLRARIKKEGLLEQNTAYSKALAAANSKEKIAIVIKAMSEDKYFNKNQD